MAPSQRKRRKNVRDPTWDHCERVAIEVDSDSVNNTRLKLVCNYCGKTFSGGVIRMKHHLARTRKNVAACEKVSEDVTNTFSKILGELKQKNCIELQDEDEFFEEENLISKRGTMDQFVSKAKAKQVTLPSMVKDRTKPCTDICRMIYAEALPFNLVKSSWFHTAVKSIGEYGKGLKPPSYHEVRVTFLKKEVNGVHLTLEKYKSEWKKTGCSLMSDGWQDGSGHSITNFLVNSPKGTVFLKKRNRLEAQRLNALVFVKYNLTLELRQTKREENGDSYDPICLSDMESDDEWITEKEDPCLPLDNSWMDMNECFEVNEGETSRDGRRGPRNLQSDRRGKRKAIEEDDELAIIDEDDEEEEEEEEYIGDDGVVVGDDLDDDDLFDVQLRDA